jgi:hypothetical protein
MDGGCNLENDNVYCCFCFLTLSYGNAVALSAHFPPDKPEGQTFYAHQSCLTKHLDPRVPVFFDLDSDYDN